MRVHVAYTSLHWGGVWGGGYAARERAFVTDRWRKKLFICWKNKGEE